MEDSAHFVFSRQREAVIEHMVVGQIMTELWEEDMTVEVSRPQIDDSGYNLIMECAGYIRHVQLKASHSKVKTASVPVNLRLALKPAGCVVWILFDSETMEPASYLWLGGGPDQPLDLSDYPSLRPTVRDVPKGDFTKLPSVKDLIGRLFAVGVSTCDVCGAPSDVAACSAFGPVTFGFCHRCVQAGAEPYGWIVTRLSEVGGSPAAWDNLEHTINATLNLCSRTLRELEYDVEHTWGC